MQLSLTGCGFYQKATYFSLHLINVLHFLVLPHGGIGGVKMRYSMDCYGYVLVIYRLLPMLLVEGH